MIGNNNIELNQSTLKVAIQHYFDTVLFAPGMSPVVTGVKYLSNSYTFEVQTKERESHSNVGETASSAKQK